MIFSPMKKLTANLDRPLKYFLLFLIILAVSAAIYAGYLFHLPAKGATDIEITVRYTDVEIFASRAGLSMDETLRFLKERGVTSIGVAEYYLWKLRRDSGCYVLSNLELVGELSLNPELFPYREFLEEASISAGLSFGDYIVFMPAGPWAEQVGEHLEELYIVEHPEHFRLLTREHEEMVLYIIQGANYENLPHLSLGAKPQELERVARAGLLINPYLSQRRIETADTVEQMLSTYDNYPLSAAVFEGGRVPGHPSYLASTADALQKREMAAVIYEYHQFPEGMDELAPLLGYNLVVMRPGKASELPVAVLNGIAERRVQMLELQLRNLFPRSGGEELQEALSRHLGLLVSELHRNGYSPGKAPSLIPSKLPLALYTLMVAGVLSLLLLLLQVFFSWNALFRLAILALGLILAFLLLRWNFTFTSQGFSLLAAILFPFYGALLFFFFPSRAKGSEDPPLRGRVEVLARESHLEGALLVRSFLRLLLVFLLSLAGGLLVHGLLTAPPFFHGMDLFRGVKAMYIIPLVAAAVLAFFVQGFSESSGGRPKDTASSGSFLSLGLPAESKGAFLAYLGRILKRPVTLGDLAVIGIILLAAFIYITRTGHVVEITPAEQAFRSYLEQILGVRPRFKEFVLGYPLALLGLYLLGSSGSTVLRRLAFLFLVVGTLAPISVVNTFAHVTAPLGLSLLRSFHGFWLGCLGGFLLLFIWKRAALLLLLYELYRKMEKEKHQNTGGKGNGGR